MAPPIHLGAWSMALMLWLPFELLLLFCVVSCCQCVCLSVMRFGHWVCGESWHALFNPPPQVSRLGTWCGGEGGGGGGGLLSMADFLETLIISLLPSKPNKCQ